MFYHRQPDTPLPHDRTFIVNLSDGTSLRVWASSQLVTIYHHAKLHQEPLWRASFLLSENPDLAALYSPRLGWDLVGLISLMRSEIDVIKQRNFKGDELRRLLGTDTVSVPSQNGKKQDRRSNGAGLKAILDFVLDHPHCTRLQIADGIHRAKTPRVIAQIEYLVQLECLARLDAVSVQNAPEFHYIFLAHLPDNFY